MADIGLTRDRGRIEEAATVFAMRESAFCSQTGQHGLDRRQRPAALRSDPIGDLGGGQRLARSPQRLHHIELGIADPYVHDSRLSLTVVVVLITAVNSSSARGPGPFTRSSNNLK